MSTERQQLNDEYMRGYRAGAAMAEAAVSAAADPHEGAAVDRPDGTRVCSVCGKYLGPSGAAPGPLPTEPDVAWRGTDEYARLSNTHGDKCTSCGHTDDHSVPQTAPYVPPKFVDSAGTDIERRFDEAMHEGCEWTGLPAGHSLAECEPFEEAESWDEFVDRLDRHGLQLICKEDDGPTPMPSVPATDYLRRGLCPGCGHTRHDAKACPQDDCGMVNNPEAADSSKGRRSMSERTNPFRDDWFVEPGIGTTGEGRP